MTGIERVTRYGFFRLIKTVASLNERSRSFRQGQLAIPALCSTLTAVVFMLLGCSQHPVAAAAASQPALDASKVVGTYTLKLPDAKNNSYTEALLLQKNGTFNIVFPSLQYGYYTVGNWKVEGQQIHLYPATVDQKSFDQTGSDLNSGKIPESERSRLELLFRDRLMTPVFDNGSAAPRLKAESPEVERAVEPKLGSGTIYLTQ